MPGVADKLSAIGFSQHKSVIVAVSGGSDSTALLVLACEYLKESAPAVRPIAVTVDHGLRPQSADEAKQVAQLCRQIAVQHVIVRWTGEKPSTGIQSAAREARYDLIGRLAADLGANLVLVGHTSDDQLETVLMRKERGDGPGIAGIAPATLSFRDDGTLPIWFARPFLSATRIQLRDELMKRGIAWIDDPSNTNPDFERVRARQKMVALDSTSIEALRVEQMTAAHHRYDLSKSVGSILQRHVSRVAPGLCLIGSGIAQEKDRSAATAALRIVMAFAGGLQRMIDERSALEILHDIANGKPFRTTGSRALLDHRKQGLFVLREDRDVRLHGHVFDGRYAVEARETAMVQAEDKPDLPRVLVAQAGRLEPPQSLKITRVLLNPWAKRVPLFDLAAASALARLVGEPAFPPPPCSL